MTELEPPNNVGEVINPMYVTPITNNSNDGVRVAVRRATNFVYNNGSTPQCFYSKCYIINKIEHQNRQQPGYQKPPETTHYIVTPNIEEYQTGINVCGIFKFMNKTYQAEKAKCCHVLDKHFSFYRVYHRNCRNEGRRLYINQFPPRSVDTDKNDTYYSLSFYNNTVDNRHLHLICEDCYQKARTDPKCFIDILTDYGLRYFWKNPIDINSIFSYVDQSKSVLKNLQISLCCFSDDINVENFKKKILRIDPNIMDNVQKMEDIEYYRQKVKKSIDEEEELTDDDNDNSNSQPSQEKTPDEIMKEILSSNLNPRGRWHNNYYDNEDDDWSSEDEEDEIQEDEIQENENNLPQPQRILYADVDEVYILSQAEPQAEFDPTNSIEDVD